MHGENPLAWEEGFPPVFGHTSLSFLKHCRGFCDAKLGDMQAALTVTMQCFDVRAATAIKQRYPNALLLPVITNNKLPQALARAIGLETYTGIREIKTLSRKSLSGMERLLHKPVFDGRVMKDREYIIVDDIVTQGGTVSALRKYVIDNGGIVSAISALAYSINSKILVPHKEEVLCLTGRFSLHNITRTLADYNIAHDLHELTRAQIKYLLLFKELGGLVNKIEKTRTDFVSRGLYLT